MSDLTSLSGARQGFRYYYDAGNIFCLPSHLIYCAIRRHALRLEVSDKATRTLESSPLHPSADPAWRSQDRAAAWVTDRLLR